MQTHFRKTFAHSRQRRDMVLMCVSDENMPKDDMVFIDQTQDRLRIPSSVEQGGIAGNFIPNKVTVHRKVIASGGDASKFPPGVQILRRGFPSRSNRTQFRGS